MKWQALYQCLKCEFTWQQPAGPTICPKCQHEYIKWLNYELLVRRNERT